MTKINWRKAEAEFNNSTNGKLLRRAGFTRSKWACGFCQVRSVANPQCGPAEDAFHAWIIASEFDDCEGQDNHKPGMPPQAMLKEELAFERVYLASDLDEGLGDKDSVQGQITLHQLTVGSAIAAAMLLDILDSREDRTWDAAELIWQIKDDDTEGVIRLGDFNAALEALVACKAVGRVGKLWMAPAEYTLAE